MKEYLKSDSKILFLSPLHGGIDSYVKVLVEELADIGIPVDLIGSTEDEFPYDKIKGEWKTSDHVISTANSIIEKINWGKYRLIAFHYGKNDLEQLIPFLIQSRGINIDAKKIYFVHFLSWLLFKKYIPNETLQKGIEESIKTFFDNYVFYGNQPKEFISNFASSKLPGIVSFYPEAVSTLEDPTSEFINKLKAKYNITDDNNNVILTGYASSYKDYKTLFKSLNHVKSNLTITIIGPGTLRKVSNYYTSSHIGNVFVNVFDDYLADNSFKVMIQNSLFGIIPYRNPSNNYDEVFQGSGVLPNYLYLGKPCIVYNSGCLPEYIGNSGIVIEPGDHLGLASAIDTMLDQDERGKYVKVLSEFKHKFSMSYHASQLKEYFNELLYSK